VVMVPGPVLAVCCWDWVVGVGQELERAHGFDDMVVQYSNSSGYHVMSVQDTNGIAQYSFTKRAVGVVPTLNSLTLSAYARATQVKLLLVGEQHSARGGPHAPAPTVLEKHTSSPAEERGPQSTSPQDKDTQGCWVAQVFPQRQPSLLPVPQRRGCSSPSCSPGMLS